MQLIKGLRESRGNGTSMISLIMPPKDQVRAADVMQRRLLLLQGKHAERRDATAARCRSERSTHHESR